MVNRVTTTGDGTEDRCIRKRRAVVSEDGTVQHCPEADDCCESVTPIIERERHWNRSRNQDRHRAPAGPGRERGNGGTYKDEDWKPERRHNIAEHGCEELPRHEPIATRF